MKKFILITVLIFISIGLSGQLSLINVGAAANDHTGDALRTAFQKVNLGITQINTNTSNILLRVPYTGATTNLNLGTNSLLLTGSIGATGSRVTKGWFTNLETTNLPTVNGGTFKSALSLTSTDVGLNNLTNKLQVELEDSANHAHANSYATGKMLADAIAGVTSEDTSIHKDPDVGLYRNIGTNDRYFLVYDIDLDGELEELAAAVVKARSFNNSCIDVLPGEYNLTAPIVFNLSNRQTEVRGNGAELWVPAGYDTCAILIQSTGDLYHLVLSDFIFNESSTRQQLWNGINFNLTTGQDIQDCHFNNLEFRYCNRAIHGHIVGTGWANANNFTKVWAQSPVLFMEIHQGTSARFDGNFFTDCQVQDGTNTLGAIDTLDGDHNYFNHFVYWDSNPGKYGIIFGANSTTNQMFGGDVGQGGYLDLSTGTNVIQGRYVTAGNTNVRQNFQVLTSYLRLIATANPPSVTSAEGMLYADTDHHLRYYNGTNWVQVLDSAETLNLSDVAPMLVDTATMFTMAIGHGAAHLAIDTTGVTVGYDLGGTFIGGSDTTGLTETILVLEASKNAPSVYINVYWGTTYGTPLDSLYTNPLQITSTSTGTSGTTGFKNQKVPPKRWIWVAVAKVPTLGAKPQFSRGAVIGYKIPTY